jgi:hypothetical protein
MARKNKSAVAVAEPEQPRFDPTSFIMDVESGEISDEGDIADGVQRLIDTGVIFHLQGSWQRMAQDFVDAGLCSFS